MLNNPVRYLDANGLEVTCGGNFCGGTSWPAYVPPKIKEPPTGFFGGEGHFFAGWGLTSVTCTDECEKKQTFRYMKFCLGGAAGASFSGGVVGGMNGKACRSETYKGYFYELGGSLGALSGGLDIGYTDNGAKIPLPTGLSGVNEAGMGAGVSPTGVMFKSSWCYYVPLQ